MRRTKLSQYDAVYCIEFKLLVTFDPIWPTVSRTKIVIFNNLYQHWIIDAEGWLINIYTSHVVMKMNLNGPSDLIKLHLAYQSGV